VTDNGWLQGSRAVTITVADNGITGFSPQTLTIMSSQGDLIAISQDGGGSITRISPMNPLGLPPSAEMPTDIIIGLFDLQLKSNILGGTVKIMFYLLKPAPVVYN